MWMIDHGIPLSKSGPPTDATRRAYDATNLSDQLYNRSTNSGDVPVYGIKFTSPIVANGKVYISTDVYGLK